jgi:hypothetical protein
MPPKKRAAEVALGPFGEKTSDQAQRKRLVGLELADGTKKNYSSKVKQLIRWIHARCPDLLDVEGLPDPQKIKEGAVIEGVQCSEADIHSLFMSHATTNEHGKPLASSTVRAARSAIKYVYTQKGMVVTEATKVEVGRVLQGQKRDIAKMRATGELEVTEGKQQFTFDALVLLAQIAHLAVTQPWCLLFLLLCWNVMAR